MRKKVVSEKNKVILNKRAGADYFKLVLESPNIADNCLPGQFIEIRISSSTDPLLRRPFSIHKIGIRDMGYGERKKNRFQKQGIIEILYQVVGKGTELLSQKKPGDYLDVIGPLGNGFIFRTPSTEHRTPIVIAGGMGVAPLLFLAEKLDERRRKKDEGREKILVLIGAKTKSHIVCADDFKELGCDVKIATDDGSQGFKGKVTELFKKIILVSRPSAIVPRVYACGPKAMLKALTQISKQYNIPTQISLESHMACGIGACLGCVVNTSGGFKRVCKDGPVFKAEEIIWGEI